MTSAMAEHLARYLDGEGRLGLGCVDPGTRMLTPLRGSFFGAHEPIGDALSLDAIQLLAPVIPSKVVAVASNYKKHAEEMGKTIPPTPKIFLKPSTAVIGPGAPIVLPPGSQRVDHEAELAVVVGRTMKGVAAADALDHILGCTVLNDVTARDFQWADGAFTRGKGFDSFCPLGPWITTGLDPADLRVRAWLDGELRQDGRTSDMAFDVPTLLEFVSGIMTLHPGDVVTTGTPSGVGPMVAGQTITVEVEGVGQLSNPIISPEAA